MLPFTTFSQNYFKSSNPDFTDILLQMHESNLCMLIKYDISIIDLLFLCGGSVDSSGCLTMTKSYLIN